MVGVIYKKIDRVPKKVIKEYKKIPTSVISDAMNRTNAMKASIKPITEGAHIAGSAITVKCIVGDNIMTHQAIYLAMPGDILVVDGRGYVDKSIWGGIQTEIAMKRGIQGVIIDGAIRDASVAKRFRYPIFCSGVVPTGPHKGWGDSINVPIQCGGVPVCPGDLIVGDEDGVVVVPKGDVTEILKKSRKIIETEKEWKKRIDEGKTTLEAIGLDKKLKELNIRVIDDTWK